MTMNGEFLEAQEDKARRVRAPIHAHLLHLLTLPLLPLMALIPSATLVSTSSSCPSI